MLPESLSIGLEVRFGVDGILWMRNRLSWEGSSWCSHAAHSTFKSVVMGIEEFDINVAYFHRTKYLTTTLGKYTEDSHPIITQLLSTLCAPPFDIVQTKS